MKIADVQSGDDPRKISIDKVGVKGIRYPIIVEDRSQGIQHTIADLDIYVELPHNKRGPPMSRFIEILNHYHQDNLIDQLEVFLKEQKSLLKADAAYVNLSFPYFIKKHAPVSKISSLLSYDCTFNACYKDSLDLWIGVRVPVTTLCPCSKEISQYGAHNQRSEISIKARYAGFVWLEELIEIAEAAASSQIYPLLKRVDEKYVTEKAYENPKFVEDIVREITQILSADTRILAFEVESENFESIHNHNAYASIKRQIPRS